MAATYPFPGRAILALRRRADFKIFLRFAWGRRGVLLCFSPDQSPASRAETLIYRFDDCVLNIERRELRRGELLRTVDPQVFDLLEYLVRHRERMVGSEFQLEGA
jgi:DNA-binding response OmpR family regulator